MKIEGLLLAGGKGRRMGGTYKGNLICDDVTFAEKIIAELKKETEKIWISYGNDNQGMIEDCEIVMDEYPGCGPISGFHAGLKKSDADAVFAAACDMPFLSSDLYTFLVKYLEPQYEGVVPMLDGRIQPLAAVYRPRIAGELEKEILEGNYKLSRVWKKLNICLL